MNGGRGNDTARREAGQAGGEVLAIGFILVISLIFLGMNAWAVVDAKIRVASAARYGVRTLVEAGPDEINAAVGARSLDDGNDNIVTGAVRSALANKPKLLRDVRVNVELSNEAYRCSRAILEVRVHVPSFGFPRVGPFSDGFEVTASQSEIVDPFRSGLLGSSDCNE